MKFLVIICLLVSMSAFSQENPGATEDHVTAPCDAAVNDQVNSQLKGDGVVVDDKSGGDGSTEQ